MTRRVLVTGATGVIGRATVPVLVAAGWQVTAVARSDAAAARVRAAGATPVTADLFDAVAVRDAVANHDAVVHLATAIPRLSQMHRRSAWALNDRLRVEATQHLVDAVRVHGVGRFLKESVTFPYRDGGDAWLDESAPVDAAVAWRATLEGERRVLGLAAEGVAAVVLRFGLLYAADARGTEEYRRLVRLRIAPVPGPSDAFVSSIRADDAATAVAAGLDARAGAYNVVDARPLRRAEYADVVARVFGAGRLHAPPSAPLRWVGGDGARSLTASHRVSNRAFCAATGWVPRWADAAVGWADALGDRRDPRGPARRVRSGSRD